MRAGLLRNRITLQTAISSTNAFGEVERTWSSTAIGNTWAQVQTQAGLERFESGAERTESRALFRVRYRTDLTANNHRVLWPANSTSGAWDIESIADIEGEHIITEIVGVKRG